MIALNVDFANYNFTLHIRMSPHLSFCLSSSLFFFLSCLRLHFLLLMHHYSLSNLHYLALIILKTSSEDEVALNCIQEPFKCCRWKYLAISDNTSQKDDRFCQGYYNCVSQPTKSYTENILI